MQMLPFSLIHNDIPLDIPYTEKATFIYTARKYIRIRKILSVGAGERFAVAECGAECGREAAVRSDE